MKYQRVNAGFWWSLLNPTFWWTTSMIIMKTESSQKQRKVYVAMPWLPTTLFRIIRCVEFYVLVKITTHASKKTLKLRPILWLESRLQMVLRLWLLTTLTSQEISAKEYFWLSKQEHMLRRIRSVKTTRQILHTVAQQAKTLSFSTIQLKRVEQKESLWSRVVTLGSNEIKSLITRTVSSCLTQLHIYKATLFNKIRAVELHAAATPTQS